MIAELNEILTIAKRISQLGEADIVISISAIGGARVHLEAEAFRKAFPECNDGHIRIDDNGKAYRHMTTTFDGVIFTMCEEVEDGLGS